MLLNFPDLRVVGGHTGAPWQQEMMYLCTKFPGNVFIDTSAYVPKRFPKDLVEFMHTRRGQKAVMFGSNYLSPKIWNPGTALSQVDSLGLSEEGLHDYLYRNAEAVFKISASDAQPLASSAAAKL